MKLNRVLIVYKKSSYQVYAQERRDRRFLKLLKSRHALIRRFLPSHEIHARSLARVQMVLERRGIAFRSVYRARVFREKDYDLILTVGGDGTFLEASHRVLRRPMLGINSSPEDSVGMFCGATTETLNAALDRIEAGRMRTVGISRLKVRIGSTALPVPVLNDVLVAQTNPAATSRFIVRFKGTEEEQKSSGLWISTPVGTTAAMKGAGGRYMPVSARGFQFRAREPYQVPGKRFKLPGGVAGPRERLVIFSKSRKGRIYLDGSHLSFPFPVGEKITVSADAPPLRVFGFDERRRKKFSK